MEVTASAPGKLFLLGEYGVALGGPAVVAAVDRHLTCRARRVPGTGILRIRTPSSEWTGPLRADDVTDVPIACRYAAAAAVVGASLAGWKDVDLSLETTSALDGSGPKVGLGGSAATVAAVLAAVARLADDETMDARRRAGLGVAIHRHVQGGGSGADVVGITFGGLRSVRGLAPEPPPMTLAACGDGVDFETAPISLPTGQMLAVVATGEAARTGPRVAKFVDAALGRRGNAAATVLTSWADGMGSAVEALRVACSRGSAARARDAVHLGRRLFDRLGALAGIPVWTPTLRRACNAQTGAPQAAIKPSGAGGGDCAIALCEVRQQAELARAWRASGLQPLDLSVSEHGARASVMPEEG